MAKTVATLPTSPSFTLVALNTSPSSSVTALNTSPSSTLVTLNSSPYFSSVSLPSSITWVIPGTWNGFDTKNWESVTSNWETTGMLGGDST